MGLPTRLMQRELVEQAIVDLSSRGNGRDVIMVMDVQRAARQGTVRLNGSCCKGDEMVVYTSSTMATAREEWGIAPPLAPERAAEAAARL